MEENKKTGNANGKVSWQRLDSKFTERLKHMKHNIMALEEYVILQSRLHKEKYDACLEEGFTKEQSLELCKSIFAK